MKVRRHCLHADGDTLGAAGLAKRERLAKMDRHLPPQVWQGERGLPVASVGCTEQREQRLVLIDRQKLSVAQRPAFRWEIERDNLDFGKERLGHSQPPV